MLIGIAGAVVAAIVVLIVLFKLMWRVAEPNEALIISGSKHRSEGSPTASDSGSSPGAAPW
ncbi:hypothetical protein GCM10025734_46060 [Kitasatospora paranensis]